MLHYPSQQAERLFQRNRLFVAANKNACFNTSAIEAFCRKTSNSSHFFIPQMSTNGVVSHILKLKTTNSCGFDSISPKILKLSTPCVAESLTYYYNLCLDKSYFLIAFKHAEIISLHKKVNLDDVNNFRPISLLSAISKPLERHIHVHMESHKEKNKLVYINQSGFRKKSIPVKLFYVESRMHGYHILIMAKQFVWFL